MTREQVRKLLGGYAAGTLTEAEETALFEAALNDQELFNELGREQALRDLLSDPAARAHLLTALDEPRPAWGLRAARWVWGNAVGLAAVACFVTVGGYVAWLARDTQKPRLIAEVTEPMRIEVTDSAPAASPQAVRKFDPASVKRKIAPPSPAPAPPSIAPRSAAAPQPALLASALPSSPPPPPATVTTGQRDFKALTESVQIQASAAELQTLAIQQQAPRTGVLSFRPAQTAEEPPEAAAKNETRQADASGRAPQLAAGRGGGVGPGSGGGVGSGMGGGVGSGAVGGVVGGMAGSAAMPSVIRLRAAFSPPIRYRILRKRPNGAFEPAVSGGLSAGDIVKLSIEPNDAGFLTVIEVGSDQPLFSGTTARTGAVTTPEIPLSGSGPKQLRVVFTRERPSAGYAAAPGAPADQAKVASDKDVQGPVYVVDSNGSPSGATFTIALTWK